jgi:chromosome segregation ATPase
VAQVIPDLNNVLAMIEKGVNALQSTLVNVPTGPDVNVIEFIDQQMSDLRQKWWETVHKAQHIHDAIVDDRTTFGEAIADLQKRSTCLEAENDRLRSRVKEIEVDLESIAAQREEDWNKENQAARTREVEALQNSCTTLQKQLEEANSLKGVFEKKLALQCAETTSMASQFHQASAELVQLRQSHSILQGHVESLERAVKLITEEWLVGVQCNASHITEIQPISRIPQVEDVSQSHAQLLSEIMEGIRLVTNYFVERPPLPEISTEPTTKEDTLLPQLLGQIRLMWDTIRNGAGPADIPSDPEAAARCVALSNELSAVRSELTELRNKMKERETEYQGNLRRIQQETSEQITQRESEIKRLNAKLEVVAAAQPATTPTQPAMATPLQEDFHRLQTLHERAQVKLQRLEAAHQALTEKNTSLEQQLKSKPPADLPPSTGDRAPALQATLQRTHQELTDLKLRYSKLESASAQREALILELRARPSEAPNASIQEELQRQQILNQRMQAKFQKESSDYQECITGLEQALAKEKSDKNKQAQDYLTCLQELKRLRSENKAP